MRNRTKSCQIGLQSITKKPVGSREEENEQEEESRNPVFITETKAMLEGLKQERVDG
ncbi:hypothetical protein J2Z82_003514 [Virgibacillus litoralis]|uniref:YfhD family protein n=1 Tax=Virgibacillus litoralis TaxID=578221 RepID=A0ABS4HIJ7_9BACI|nr:hypothetical protein [Virgibacillus litoralis]